jgi:hypothetical protein
MRACVTHTHAHVHARALPGYPLSFPLSPPLPVTQDVDVALMNASSQWHWSAGDPDADFNDAAQDGALLLTAQDDAMPSDALQLTYCGAVGAAGSSSSSLPAPPSGAIVPAGDSQGLGYGGGGGYSGGGGGSGALVAYDAAKAAAGRRRVIVGSDGIRQSGALVPKATKDALSNERLRPVDSGRGLALLEKVS